MSFYIVTAISNFTCHCEEAEVGRQRVLLVASPVSKTHGLLTARNDTLFLAVTIVHAQKLPGCKAL